MERRHSALWRLVRRTVVRRELGIERLEHHPLTRAHAAQLGQLGFEECAGVGVGEEAGLVEHEPAHRDEVVDRRFVAVLPQPVAGCRVPLLGTLAEGEQRLVTAGGGASARNR